MTRLVRFANNAASKLAANLASVGLTCTVTPGDGAKFPALSAGQFFMATLVKVDGTKEIVRVTARATDTFTIVRAAEAVGGVQVATSFTAGDRIELRNTAEALGNELSRLDLSSIVRVSTRNANYTVLAADLNTLFRVDTSVAARTITLPAISAMGEEFKLLVSKITSDSNIVTIAANGSDTINGLSTYNLTQQWAGAWLIADKATNTWTAINSGSSAGNWVIDAFTGAGAAGPFTLSGDPGSKNNTNVYVGGVYQQKSSYTLVGLDITLGGTVAAGVSVEVIWSAPVAFGVPNNLSVTSAKIADGAVTTAKILDANVTTAKLADDAVTFAKMQNIATARLMGRSTAATGDPEALTGAQAQALLPVQQARIDIASAGTVDLTAGAPDTDHINITGTTTINGFTVAAGRTVFVRFAGALTLTNGAGLVIQNGANITTAAGDTCVLRATAANTVEVLFYSRAQSQALGDGQSWQNVTGSRASGTTYTNTTGRSIMVAVTAGSGTSSSVLFNVAGVEIVRSSQSVGGGSFQASVCVVVPPGATYSATVSPSISNWQELRA